MKQKKSKTSARVLVLEPDEQLASAILNVLNEAAPGALVEMTRSLGIPSIRHDRNRGYGSNQKICYAAALARKWRTAHFTSSICAGHLYCGASR